MKQILFWLMTCVWIAAAARRPSVPTPTPPANHPGWGLEGVEDWISDHVHLRVTRDDAMKKETDKKVKLVSGERYSQGAAPLDDQHHLTVSEVEDMMGLE